MAARYFRPSRFTHGSASSASGVTQSEASELIQPGFTEALHVDEDNVGDHYRGCRLINDDHAARPAFGVLQILELAVARIRASNIEISHPNAAPDTRGVRPLA